MAASATVSRVNSHRPRQMFLRRLLTSTERAAKSAETSHESDPQIDHVAKLFSRAVELAEKELGAKENGDWSFREVKVAAKALDDVRQEKLRDLCEFVDYGYTASAEKDNVGPALANNRIVGQHINWDEVPYCLIDERKKKKFELHEGDIVVAQTGSNS